MKYGIIRSKSSNNSDSAPRGHPGDYPPDPIKCNKSYSVVERNKELNNAYTSAPHTSKLEMGSKVQVMVGVKLSVAKKIDECAYRAGMARHIFIKNALIYAVTHKLDAKTLREDEKIKKFLNLSKKERRSDLYVRIRYGLVKEIDKLAKKQGLTQQEYVSTAVAYYIIYVLRLVE
jgi:phosphorylcholine metabolism protein LicD